MKRFAVLYALRSLLVSSFQALWKNKLLFAGHMYSELATVVSVKTVISTLLDIPTGFLADHFGYKITTLLGFGLIWIGFMVPAMSHPALWVYGACVVLVGLGGWIVNGAMDSWAAFSKHDWAAGSTISQFARRDQCQKFGMILSAGVIALLVKVDISRVPLVWWGFVSGAVLLFFVGVMTPPDPVEIARSEGKSEPFKELGRSFLALMSYPSMRWLLFGVFGFGISDGVRTVLFWPKVQSLNVKEALDFGIVQVIAQFSWLFGLFVWRRTPWIEDRRVAGYALIGGSVFYFWFTQETNPAYATVAWILRTTIASVYFAGIQNALVSHQRSEKIRATILSTSGVMYSVAVTLITGIMGMIGDQVEIKTMFVVGPIAMCFGGICILRGLWIQRETTKWQEPFLSS